MVDIADPDMPQVHLALAFQGVSWTDPDAVPLMVMQSYLGTWAPPLSMREWRSRVTHDRPHRLPAASHVHPSRQRAADQFAWCAMQAAGTPA